MGSTATVGLASAGAVALGSLGELALQHAAGQAPDLWPVLGATAALAGVAAGLALGLARAAPAWLAIALAVVAPLALFAHSAAPLLGVGSPRLFAGAVGGLAAGLAGLGGRQRLGAAGLAGAAALAFAVAGVAARSPAPAARDATGADERPDIVLLVLDTTRRDRLSLYAPATGTTPSLDALAREARVYDDAWASAPWTSPSHASLFTGLLPAEHGADGRDAVPLPPGPTTLADVLQRAGYRTAGFAANPNLHSPGWSRGFDVYRPPWIRGDHTLVPLLNDWLRGGGDPWLQHDATTRVLDAGRHWWERNQGAPRYLFLNVLDPHNPYWAPEPDRARFLEGLECGRALELMADARSYYRGSEMSEQDTSCLRALYDAELFAMDRAVGDFFDWLAERGELDRTLVAVTSDHGERLGEAGRLGHLLAMDPHLLRVPLFVRYPPALPPGRVAERVQLVGLPGFLLATAGIEAPRAMASRAFARQTEAPAVAQHRDFGWYVERIHRSDPDFDASPHRGDWVFVADEEHALLWSPQRGESGARLFAWRDDPELAHDLSARQPAVTRRLTAVARELPRFGAEPPAAAPTDRELRERLEALGYAEPD
jgi:arylsulfatase A-like enzyme